MNGMWILSVVLIVVVFDGAIACTYTHSQAFAEIHSAGISISSSGGCSDRNNPKCTSLDQVQCSVIRCLIALKTSSGCPMTITGGTEIGHTPGTNSHSSGYKIDISLNSCITPYVTSHFKSIGTRSDGAAQYQASNGNIYAKEGDHWDITFTASC